jgi:imidazolonepropionase-like amidohydrolase/ABC-type multidrug transport system permease subunit
MNAYIAQSLINLKLTYRDKTVIFFNYAFPLIFFFVFAGMFKAERGGAIVQVLTMVLTIGILGSGFFGAGIRAVQDRELGILRRFKVAPITAAPMLISSVVTGVATYLPGALLIVLLSHFMYGMPFPPRWISLFAYISLGVVAFRCIGLIVASVCNSMQESQILVQLLYFPMLMLSGATIPLTVLPGWLQTLAQFIPSTYLITGMQSILTSHESFWQNISGAAALALTSLVALFVSLKLFRWEKDERLPASSKLWIAAALTPFLLLGIYQARTKENVGKAKILQREQQRTRTFLVREVRIFIGDGRVIESGAVLVKNGKIEHIYEGTAPDPASLNADTVEGSGKTLIPGLIDVHVHLSGSGGFIDSPADVNLDKQIPRELAAYLYSGVTAVKSVGDPLGEMQKFRQLINSSERMGAELFICGPMFTTAGGHGTEYFKSLPDNIRKAAEAEAVRTPKSPEEARQQVADLKKQGVDGIKAILETGQAGMLFNRLDTLILKAIADEARAHKLPIVIHTGDSKDVADALDAGTNGIEHGSARDAIADDLFTRMKANGTAYDPTLSVMDAFQGLANGVTDPLDRTLVQQVGPASLLTSTRAFLKSSKAAPMRARLKELGFSTERARQNLLKAWQAGVLLVTGSDAGNPLVWHGPTIHREMQLWVDAGIPAPIALQAATYNAARLLRADNRIGLIANGREATMLLVNGNPLKDIRSTENIVSVFFKGERVDRPGLFEQE